jgi:N-acetylneuraminate synthase
MKKYATVIAEIGGTHIGKVDRAKELIKLAKEAGADVVKFQKRNPYESVAREWWDRPHPNQTFSYGDTYLEHRLNLELSQDQHAVLKEYCEKIGIVYSTSVWDETSTKEIVELQPDFIKIPSACNHRTDLIDYIYDNSKCGLHISTGMTNHVERDLLFTHILEKDKNLERTVIYHCTSGYPVPFDKLYLQELTTMSSTFKSKCDNLSVSSNLKLGFSNHGYGIAMEPAAYVLGARYFERHFIDDRSFRHTDASCSLEKQGLKKLIRDLRALEVALEGKPYAIDDIEMEQRNKLRA